MSLLDTVINKGHFILAALCQAAVLVMHYGFHKDISVNVQGTVYAFYGFLGAHALTYQKYPDQQDPKPDNPDAPKQ